MGNFLKNFKTHKKLNLFKCPKFYRTNCDLLLILIYLQIFLLLVTVINCSEFNLINSNNNNNNNNINSNNENKTRLIVFSDYQSIDNSSENVRLNNNYLNNENINNMNRIEKNVMKAVNEDEEEEEDVNEEELNSIKLQQIVMQGLGLKSLPDVNKINISQEEYVTKYNEYLSRVLERKKRELRDHNSYEHYEDIIDPVRLYTIAHNSSASESHGRRYRRSVTAISNHDIVYVRFPIEVDTTDSDIQEGTLRLLLVARKHQRNPHHHPHHDQSKEAPRPSLADTANHRVVNLKVYQLTEPYGRIWLDSRTIEFDLVESTSRWIEFDVTKAVESWLVAKQSNLGLELQCDNCHAFGVHIMDDTSLNSAPDSSPMLNIVGRLGTHREKRSRQHHHYMQAARRKPRKTDCVQENNKCCRHKMEVVFSEIKGYDFIIQPKTFDAGYCRGKCPPRYNPAHQHAFFQSLIWKQDKNKAPRPCCAPSKLAELEVLHVDEKNKTRLKVSTWKDMRVQECACS